MSAALLGWRFQYGAETSWLPAQSQYAGYTAVWLERCCMNWFYITQNGSYCS